MQDLILAISAIIVIILIFKIFSAPIRLLFKLALSTVGGFFALFLFNLFSSFTGIYIEPSILNAAIVGLLGLPGFGLLLVARWIMLT